MNDYEQSDAVEEVAVAERKTFDLHKRLAGITNLTDTVTVFTDLETGKKHKAAERRVVSLDQEAWGLRTFATSLDDMGYAIEAEYLRERADKSGVDRDALDAAKAEEKRLADILLDSALTIKLQGVPSIAVKKATREVRSDLGIKGSVPEAREEEFQERVQARVLSLMTVSIKDHSDGAINDGISPEGVQELADMLPLSEYAKIVAKATELRNGETFSDSLVNSVDF